MATGASNAQLAVILIDARKGVLVQTRRHSFICSLLGIRHVVSRSTRSISSAIDKDGIRRALPSDYAAFASELGFASIVPIPISARFGDNVTALSANTPWYRGPTLLAHLETVDVDEATGAKPFRFPVQWVNRPNLDFRGYAGTVASGRIRTGDADRGRGLRPASAVDRIVTYDGDIDGAEAGDAVTMTLADEIDVARGDVLVGAERAAGGRGPVRRPCDLDGPGAV